MILERGFTMYESLLDHLPIFITHQYYKQTPLSPKHNQNVHEQIERTRTLYSSPSLISLQRFNELENHFNGIITCSACLFE